MFMSARKDWPYKAKLLRWEASSAIDIVNDVPGILVCKEHNKNDLNYQVI